MKQNFNNYKTTKCPWKNIKWSGKPSLARQWYIWLHSNTTL